MRRHLVLFLLASGLAACSTKTVLTLDTLPEADLRLELHRLFRLMHMDVEVPIEAADVRARAVWKDSLPDDTQARLRRFLDRAITLEAVGVPVSFDLVVSDSDPQVRQALGLTSERQSFPVVLLRDRGDLHLKSTGADVQQHQLCTWDVPVDRPLPVLSYQIEAPPEANPDDPRVVLVQRMSTVVRTVRHQTLATPGALQSLADEMQYHDTTSASFVFGEGPNVYEPVLGAFALSQSYSDCADRILDKADDDFFRVVLFPELSRALASYTLEDRRFVGSL